MTEDQHMQKAREIAQGIRFLSIVEQQAEAIATALSEAYRSGVEEERERAALVLEKAASDGDAVADKLGNGEAKRHLVGEGNLLRVLADAIRKP